MRILLVEDDPLIGDGIAAGLPKLGMTVDWFRSGKEGEAALECAPYDAVILDLGLPQIDGIDILSHWRKKGLQTPVLILTARGTLEDKLQGLNSGADDYLSKPFSLDEVAARLNALVRRSHGFSHTLLTHGRLTLDTSAKTAKLGDEALELTAREYVLLELLLMQSGRIITRAQIEDKLYGWDQEIDSNAVEVYIHRLRKKLGNNFILTKRRLGYVLGEKP
ncbi:MAG: response regulator [Neisseriaceae bacterium]|nr:response regulator [Neisseriaceae bacterium]